jgi:hypothetical protein
MCTSCAKFTRGNHGKRRIVKIKIMGWADDSFERWGEEIASKRITRSSKGKAAGTSPCRDRGHSQINPKIPPSASWPISPFLRPSIHNRSEAQMSAHRFLPDFVPELRAQKK